MTKGFAQLNTKRLYYDKNKHSPSKDPPSSFLTLNILSPQTYQSNELKQSYHSPSKEDSHSGNLSPSLSFLITKAHIKESLESLFNITCEGYIESLQEHPFTFKNNRNITSALNHSASHLNFHPDTLINKQATFRIENPYTFPEEKNTLVFNNTSLKALASLKTANTNGISQGNKAQGAKEYKGILSFVEYLGLNPQSSANILNRANESKVLNHKHFFKLTLTSPLIRMSLNKANRIYTDKTIVEVIQMTLDFHQETIGKNLDFSHLHLSYPKLELITQYQESDLDFITRLTHNNGIYFYEDDHSIYFNDFSQKENPRSVLFNPKSNNTLNEPCISSFYKQQSLKSITLPKAVRML